MSATSSQSIEYAVYVFTNQGNQKQQPKWEKHMTCTDMHKAIDKAQSLHSSAKYQKIEVKKKFYDPKNARTIDMSIKTYERKAKSAGLNTATILLIGVGLAILAFCATYFLAQ